MNSLSIITINRNNSIGLRKTIESVVSQIFCKYEYIIIDGASTDSSVDVIKEFSNKLEYWISEPDKGIYNAMNKGILKATSDYCLFLNSGDWFVDKNVIRDFCNSKFDEDIISGNIYLFDECGSVLRESVKKENFSYETLFYGTLPHQATFIKRELFLNFGLYNEGLKIVSDWEFFIKALIVNNSSYNHIDRVISFYDLNGISANIKWNFLHENEREFILCTTLPFVYKSFKKITDENKKLRDLKEEYLSLKNGKFSYFIFIFLWLKKIKKVNKNKIKKYAY